MPRIDYVRESKIVRTTRVRQLEAMFDVPAEAKSRRTWSGDFPFDEKPWNIGLIVGASGSGKSTILSEVFGQPRKLRWSASSVVDDFDSELSMEEISGVCQAVGFNTIPAWMRPFAVLSNGEKFRVEMARRLLETEGKIVVDEFTSVIDRQVAKIGSHAIQKYVRRHDKQFVAASCHFDVVDWLQPDWILEPGTMSFRRRRLRQRPKLEFTISAVPYAAWNVFAPFHYLTAKLHKGARCYGGFVGDRITTFAGVMKRPHPTARNVYGVSRLVTLPDWQGLGLAMILVQQLGEAHKALGNRLRTYPAHPALIRAFTQSPVWSQKKRGGDFSPKQGKSSTMGANVAMGGRACAVFEYIGPPCKKEDAIRLINRNPQPEKDLSK